MASRLGSRSWRSEAARRPHRRALITSHMSQCHGVSLAPGPETPLTSCDRRRFPIIHNFMPSAPPPGASSTTSYASAATVAMFSVVTHSPVAYEDSSSVAGAAAPLWDFVLVIPEVPIHPAKQETSGVGRNDTHMPNRSTSRSDLGLDQLFHRLSPHDEAGDQ
jgi:hypothetical protein